MTPAPTFYSIASQCTMSFFVWWTIHAVELMIMWRDIEEQQSNTHKYSCPSYICVLNSFTIVGHKYDERIRDTLGVLKETRWCQFAWHTCVIFSSPFLCFTSSVRKRRELLYKCFTTYYCLSQLVVILYAWQLNADVFCIRGNFISFCVVHQDM